MNEDYYAISEIDPRIQSLGTIDKSRRLEYLNALKHTILIAMGVPSTSLYGSTSGLPSVIRRKVKVNPTDTKFIF